MTCMIQMATGVLTYIIASLLKKKIFQLFLNKRIIIQATS